MHLPIPFPITSICKYTTDFQYTKKKLSKCTKTRMKPYRPSCDLSGYTPINKSIITTFSVISENYSIFASKYRLYSMVAREQYIKKIQPFMVKVITGIRRNVKSEYM